MAAYVASLSATMDDNVSAGSDAATASLLRQADAADKATAALGNTATVSAKVGASANALINQLDPVTKAANALAAAQDKLSAATITLAAATDANSDKQAAAQGALDTLAAKVRVAQTAYDQLTGSASASAAQFSSMVDPISELSAAMATAQNYQDKLNASFGIAARTDDGYEQRAADIAAYGASLDAVRAKFDPVFNISKRYEATLDEIALAERNGAISASVANTARTTATATFSANIDAANRSAVALDTASHSTAGFYREILVLGHEVVTGNFSRIPGSIMVLAERSGSLETIFEKVIAAVTSLPGILTLAGVAGVAAFTYLAVSSDNATQRLIELQTHLRATRSDYVSMGAEAAAAAQGAARTTPGLSLADAYQASNTISSSPQFVGTTAQLQSLVVTAADIAKVFNETVDKASSDLATALQSPGDAAEKLVGKLQGMTQALADSIVAQAAAGDKAGAFARILDLENAATVGAAKEMSPLRDALRDIETAFSDTGAAGSASGQGIGSAFANAAKYILEAVAAVLGAIKSVHDITGQMLPWAANYGSPTTAAGEWAATGSGAVYSGINTTGAQLGLTQDQIDLSHRISIAESGGRQTDLAGNVITSPAGALGAMQVMPGTAAQYGQDPNTLQGNLTAGEQLVVHLWTKYNGNQTLVAAAYNWGEGNLDKWIASGGATAVRAETQKYIAKVTPGQSLTVPSSLDGNAAGVANNSVVDQALLKSTGSITAQSDALKAEIQLLDTAKQNLADTGQVGSDAWNRINTQLRAATLQYSELQDPLTKTLTEISDQRDAQTDLAAAYAKGSDAVADTTAHTQAFNAALKTVGLQSPDFSAAVDNLTLSYRALGTATQEAVVAQQTAQNGDTLQYLQAETASIGDNSAARDIMLAHMKAEQELRAKNVSDLSVEGQAYLASVDAISQQTAALAKSQQTMSDLESLATSSFDTISSAITNAFAQGGKSAIDFGNIARTVFSQVVADVLKIGVLNPVLNSLFGGNRTTLSDVQGLLGSLGGGAQSGSISGIVSIPGTTIGGLAQSTPTLSVPAYGGGLSGVLSTPTFGTGTIGSTLGGVAGGFGIGTTLNSLIGGNSTGGAVGSAVGAAAGAAIGSIIPGIGTLIGGLIGGAGGGLLGGLFGNSKPSDMTMKAQQNLTTGRTSTIGESSGAEYSAGNLSAAQNLASTTYTAAQALASAFNLVLPNVNVNAKIGNRDGDSIRIGSGATYSTTGNTAADAASLVNQAIGGLVKSIGGTLDKTTAAILKGIDFSSSTAATQVAALAAALTNGKLDAAQTAALPKLNTADAAGTITELGWIKNTYEATVNSASNIGSIATQTAAVNSSFVDLIAHAQRLGLATDVLVTAQNNQVQAIQTAAAQTIAASGASIRAGYQKQNGDTLGASLTTFDASAAQEQQQLTTEFQSLYGDAYKSQAAYVAQTALLTQTISQQRQDLINAAALAATTTMHTTDAAWVSSITAGWKAQAAIAGLQGTAGGNAWASALNEDADLANFDAQSKTTTDAYSAQLTAAYGQGYTQSATYAKQMVDLEDSLAEQRLVIQATYAAQSKAAQTSAESSAASVISGLATYAAGLAVGSASPLNAQGQYAFAQKKYQTDLAAAQGGSTTALSALQGDSSTFLTASQNLNGSGAGYVADFNSVVNALQTVANMSQAAITEEFMQTQFETQTQVLNDTLLGLRTDVQTLKAEMQQANSRPV